MNDIQAIAFASDVQHETNHADDDRITVTEIFDESGGSVLDSVLGVYEQHGYAAGYERAVQDVSLSLLEIAEDLVRRRGLDAARAADLRQAVWALREDLQRRPVATVVAAPVYVEGGLGI